MTKKSLSYRKMTMQSSAKTRNQKRTSYHNLLFVVGAAYSKVHDQNFSKIYSIFRELCNLRVVTTHEHATNHTEYSAYSGPPDTANAAAWTHLMQPLYFNASEEELLSAGASPADSVRVKNGGYIASLGVYHELHCLVKMRNFLYLHRHSQNFSSENLEYWYDHLDHCIELLRISSMCTPDLSVYSFTWPSNQNASFLDAHSYMPRNCIDWRQLEAYTWKRRIGLTPTLLYSVPD
ncbi:hypothetical protein BCR34DRAFT_552734 [Clohesyomyces aquaticus]|uniref:Uncharacterized protein n=1 Tax=Clohesyomyces aquaticus TaxID=1231657 RepID=A0A1Y2A9I8_9PLEO|nr:hypothetical protein BCR34DRAFT_552734 [Clohesyomyces aquaticus]